MIQQKQCPGAFLHKYPNWKQNWADVYEIYVFTHTKYRGSRPISQGVRNVHSKFF